MITELTKEQEAKMPLYVEKWTKLGLTTKQRKLKDAKKDFSNFYTHILKKPVPSTILLCDSPASSWKEITKFLSKKEGREVNISFIYPYFDCQFWAQWTAFYDFMKEELKVVYENDVEYETLKACQAYGMVFPLDEICVVCQPPTIIKRRGDNLHCEDGPALTYNGDNEIYALNGVVMKKEYVMTPAEKISPKEVLKETNAEIRRELLRKVGIERMLEELPNKVLDKRGNYELYSIELSPEIKDARYLKMTNPSIGVFHLEGVDPSIKTVNEALEWRNDKWFTDAEALT